MPYGTYLTRNRHHTNWYARIVIPHDLRHAYGQRREIRKTLDTPCKVTARRRAMMLWLAYQQVFESLRNGRVEDNISPDWKTLAFLASSSLSSLQTDTAPGDGRTPYLIQLTPLANDERSEGRFAMPFVRTCEHRSPQGKGGPGPAGAQSIQGSAAHPQRLSALFEQFVTERLVDARDKTKETMRQNLQVFTELMGDLTAEKLTKSVVRSFIKQLKTYPTHRNHGRWKSMTLSEIRVASKKPMGHKTQQNIIGNLHTFAGWLVEVEELESNPFKIKLRKKAMVPGPDRTWRDEELSRWFHSDLLMKHRGSRRYAWKYWLPLLAIHTGARLEELAALSPDDFFEHEGIQAFKIHGEDGRFVKNVSSWRMIPVHSRLISLGFLEYVESRRGSERLFTVEPYQGQYGKRASKAFGYLRGRLGISPDFHGYRHTVIEALKLRGASLTHIEWLVGHTGASMSDHYGSATDKRKWLPVLKEVVELLDWSYVMPGSE
ncbi:hypothetical protein L861_19835 [Litchfieldella anticariensis FP35 = DSM 16096]|uniref:Tyr recombinase domain-containing protein n=1 Tax=Litchfieldella anticariensis (strain DSM 16096 / CECT 5854 / CIP 108499 / LMG 22089 / FP35) TaxID=1121939 RepID=S2L2K5_LITA3|nr:site-specific integrase [Halomonas anticariensis]EPC01904.1 hypothetical protein L861_19835 [Halomonas anticariensis FP35 = DSM 16096]